MTDPNAFIPDSVVFVSASANPVSLLGTGNNNSSTLTYEVRNALGQPIPNLCVSFTLAGGGLGGGEVLNPAEAPATGCTQLTNGAGQINTIFRGGTKPGTVNIVAFIDADNDQMADVSEKKTSATLSVNSGPPSGLSFSLAAEFIEKGQIFHDGGNLAVIADTNEITATLSDAFTNPVPENTTVSFQTFDPDGLGNAFTIEGSGTTGAGNSQVVVEMSSLEPAPIDGRVTAIGSAQGGLDAGVLSLVRRAQDNALFAGTDGGGIYRSQDNGASWTMAGNPDTGLFNGIIYDLVQDPTDPTRILAATYRGIYSSQTGVNWVPADASARVYNEAATNICGAFTTPCANWQISQPAVRLSRTRVVAAGNEVSDFGFGTYTSQAASGSTLAFPSPVTEVVVSYDSFLKLPRAFPVRAMVADTNDVVAPGTFFAGLFGDGVYRTVNGGNAWSKISGGLSNLNIQSLAFDPDAGGRLYAGTEGGGAYVCADCDNPANSSPIWTQINGSGGTSLLDLNVTAIADAPGANTVCAGTKTSGVQCSTDFGATWSQATAAPFITAGDREVTDLKGINATTFVALTTEDASPASVQGNLWLSTTAAPAFSAATATGVTNRFFQSVIQAGTEIIIGARGRSVFRSTDTGANFVDATGTSPAEIVNNIFTGVTPLYSGDTQIFARQISGPGINGAPGTPGVLTNPSSALYRVTVREDAFNRALVSGSQISINATNSEATFNVNAAGTGTFATGPTEFYVQVQNSGPTNTIVTDITVNVSDSSNGDRSVTVASVTNTP